VYSVCVLKNCKYSVGISTGDLRLVKESMNICHWERLEDFKGWKEGKKGTLGERELSLRRSPSQSSSSLDLSAKKNKCVIQVYESLQKFS